MKQKYSPASAWGKPVVRTTPLRNKRMLKKIFSMSGKEITNISERDRLWVNWLNHYGASDSSIRRFLTEYPPK